MRETQLIWAGYALSSGWLAMIRSPNGFVTFALRYLAAVGIPFLASFILWAPASADKSFGFFVILAALAIPVVIATLLFDLIRRLTGTIAYLVLIVAASAFYVVSFQTYLRS